MKINEYKTVKSKQPRMRVEDIAEILLQRIDGIETFCKRIEAATNKPMKVDTSQLDNLKNDFKAISGDLAKLTEEVYPESVKKARSGLNEVIEAGENRLRKSMANTLNGKAFTCAWVVSILIAIILAVTACFVIYLQVEENTNYKQFIYESPKIQEQYEEWQKIKNES